MTVTFALRHASTYRFRPAVALSPHELRLRPAPDVVTVTSWSLDVAPAGSALRWRIDDEGTWVGRLDVAGRVERMELTVHAEVRVPPGPAPARRAHGAPRSAHRRAVPAGPALTGLVALGRDAATSGGPGSGSLADVERVTSVVADRIAHRRDDRPGTAAPEATAAAGVGSCRDSAWVLVQVLRHLGWPARLSAGYLVDAGALPGAERLELHAWAEAHVDPEGWVGLDATSGARVGGGHVTLTSAAEPAGILPVQGRTEPCSVSLEVVHDITRLDVV